MAGSEPTVLVEDDRTGMDPITLRRAMLDHLRYTRAKDMRTATLADVYQAMAHTVRDRLVDRWMRTQRQYAEADVKRVYYLSAEYLLGRQLEANLLTLDLRDFAREGMAKVDVDMDKVIEQEPDPGLGNGGLGRLAACFMDSLATLSLPATGYGIRYEFGIFRQQIENGWQLEQPDEWLARGNPWELKRPEYTVSAPFGAVWSTGRTRTARSACAGSRSTASTGCPTTHPSRATTPPPSTRSASGAPRRASSWTKSSAYSTSSRHTSPIRTLQIIT